MKKCFSFFLILSVLVAGVFAAGSNRQKIDDFLKAYEEYVVAYEEASESENLNDLMKLSQKSLEMSKRCNEIQTMEGWTFKDSKKLLELEARLADAVDDMDDEDDDDEDYDDYDMDDYMDDLESLESLYNLGF